MSYLQYVNVSLWISKLPLGLQYVIIAVAFLIVVVVLIPMFAFPLFKLLKEPKMAPLFVSISMLVMLVYYTWTWWIQYY